MPHRMSSPAGPHSQRDTIHDLRNLFGIVASAAHLLETGSDRRASLIAAIETAASKGGALTSRLLEEPRRGPARTVDLAPVLTALAPLLGTIADGAPRVSTAPGPPQLPVQVDPLELESALLELATNARSAAGPAGRVVVRVRRVGSRLWLIVADTGAGMTAAALTAALCEHHPQAGRGSGLGIVQRFVRAAHGRLLIRTRPGRGTMIVMNLPMVLAMTVPSPAAGSRHPSNPEETFDENRQPVAA
ncbi:sensor histidine kinase [Sphingomonas hylomeconis]|uniref:histidine kinase n=1 Tax=Sphingomonas hylomeconis TaxID=1395958 RepID=A0ABV7T019_9SPHN|nr:ATP-binding protein [Sphingomonas hylomeconis]